MGFPIYPLPEFLNDIWTQLYYGTWLTRKANEARRHDIARNSPFPARYSQKDYRRLIHEAVVTGNGIDPFTGEILRFDLALTYDAKKARGDIAYEKQFDLMPTVDHTDPDSDILALEICSWRINFCKSFQNPAEFIATCKKVVDYTRGLQGCRRVTPGENHGYRVTPGENHGYRVTPEENHGYRVTPEENHGYRVTPEENHGYRVTPEALYRGNPTSPARWLLPPYLDGRCTLKQFRKWLFGHAAILLSRDKKLGRPYALDGCMELYKQIIYGAAQNGMLDPFTGESLQWESIDSWNPRNKDPNANSVRKFRLLPTADHVDPASDVLDIEICSWFMNDCKGNLNPQEFIAICGKVARNAEKPQ